MLVVSCCVSAPHLFIPGLRLTKLSLYQDWENIDQIQPMICFYKQNFIET